ncbi:MAG TPA: YbhB/YbcL family Raf kinase inhibitor-like protein [Solirubrobacteraceae bacterium]|nr:YbhB/YbcL family Raf kinase inhibitor-like protein [Solirubrobacteraceae bacterium]
MRHAGRPSSRIALAALIAAFALTGCGSSGSQPQVSASAAITTSTSTTASQSPTSTRAEQAQNRSIELSSPAIPGTGEFPPIQARYTCDGADISPPLHWSNIPAGAQDLALVVLYVDQVRHEYRFDWVVAGLKPALHGLSADRLPAGAIVGRNSNGQTRYSVCSPKGVKESYGFILYALPHRIALKPGFWAKALLMRAGHEAIKEAVLRFSYKR